MTKKTESNQGTNRLVVFDVEGVIIPKNRYLLFEISRKTGFLGFMKTLVLGGLYEIGILSLSSALRKIYAELRGINAEDIFTLQTRIPLIPGVKEVFEKLNNKGYKTALISSGLPIQFVKDLATKLKANYAYGLELEIVDGQFTGAIDGEVLKSSGKAVVLKKILEENELEMEDCIMVADDRNNRSMFPHCNLRIGYNPGFVLSAKCDFVTRGELTEILPPITGETQSNSQVFISKSRGLRETIHISSFLLSFVCIYILGNVLLASLIILVAVLYAFSELARVRGMNVPILSAVTWNAANKNELYEFAASPIHFAFGIAISLLVFPEPICYVAITTLTLGDGCAHILGRKFKRTPLPFNKGKSIDGTVFGFLFAFLGARFFVDPVRALVGAAVGMLVESLPIPINDNLTIPITSGLVLTLLM